ncbi:putative cardiolipin synthase [Marivita hallyeonensis]|uniref:Phospholipase D n=1 Tax=Marivita hallyeonensis TaxID=996342 RepID=A0A1M5MXX6_9RHOB|nr:putative cardiolipin synthase [Marivita hallyeonensis]
MLLRISRLIAATGLLLAALFLLSLSSCTYVPFEEERVASQALPGDGTEAANLAAQLSNGDADYTALVPLLSGNDALGARLRMIEGAQESIDLQTFLIKPDMAGTLVWLELYQAAERGVRVRLLFDDVFTTARDDQIATLDAHPNVEIRVFNPLSRNSVAAMNFLLDFARVNRRMHNKAMVADASLAIIGGRNIADEYYQIGTDHEFADFDLLLIGAVTDEVSEAFDLYWNDQWSVPLENIATSDPSPLQQVVAEFRERSQSELYSVYSGAIESDFLTSVANGTTPLNEGTARIIVDHPQKLRLRPGRGPSAVAEAFYDTMERARDDILIMTPYFVPQDALADLLISQAQNGVRVRVVTNSLASNNHAYVHGGYANYRERLLAAGVELLEVRADAPALVNGLDTPLTMHTKLAVIDGTTVFAGSTNVDPRSFKLNTEVALIGDSTSLAQGIRSRVDAVASDYAFQVRLTDNEKLAWYYEGTAGAETYSTEPGARLLDRIVAKITSWLPVEGQL